MNIVTKTLELLLLSYIDDFETQYKAECEIFDNFNKMTPQEMETYRIEANKVKDKMENKK